ncbi:MAG TPA: protein-L-isoaspartate(D-aspartate) O-methyltransferase [Chromatiaceae bacterium]|jgi:protein-L-isoaspartate(D-aspartate) O-methyltransferase|nr:protein-L-isoaspartate(D-aspartate) O-methyltransferase [Chromatiaceae bacterium]HIA08667.1 protein-L-isoaspartate(D-aspartate) O-methyltransferase [Chromatiaceae bacterium]HIB83246.1 protein-L-isoaspartate(D-aspartate) O-methyltransferase [Chromatiaceae bacterium]HIN82331.1 protein-L-isoaspartate(D-aspartate) O-methyltransferase [Chromatiales bacterium]HIO55082.1 protein-L-isoaspartate(D-aspartate) O-methyltransferase [Chromatiales bacterium]
MTSQRTRSRLAQRLKDHGIDNQKVLAAIRDTPRHIFVDEALASRAYEDTALPIGFGQTISQPYIVARMSEILITHVPNGKILEVGTGSGYQAAILAQLFPQVYSVERIAGLQRQARSRLREMDLHHVRFKHTDGSWGWEQNAPYDGIILTAAPLDVPQTLLDQLAIGGVLIAPVGGARNQILRMITRSDTGFEHQDLEPVIFVPMLSGTT